LSYSESPPTAIASAPSGVGSCALAPPGQTSSASDVDSASNILFATLCIVAIMTTS
jgi:hypothetical protein